MCVRALVYIHDYDQLFLQTLVNSDMNDNMVFVLIFFIHQHFLANEIIYTRYVACCVVLVLTIK